MLNEVTVTASKLPYPEGFANGIYLNGAYYGPVAGGVGRSHNNLWENIPARYNSNSGYVYSLDDLKRRYIIQSSHVLSASLKNIETNGQAAPIGLQEWIDYKGVDYYNMHRLSAGMALGLPPYAAPLVF